MNKPKIRFNEFENIWTKSKLGEIYEVYSGNTPSRSDDRNYQNGEIPWIKTTDLNNTVICSNEEKISVYGATKLKVLPEKSVLIAMYGGFNQIGRTGLLAYPATINQALAALMPVNEINPNFLLNFLNFKKESWRNVAASSRKDPNITKNDVEKFKISFPSLDEQSAIGSLFRTLDDLLASYKDNLANYQSLKATMLSKMFPKAGQTVPEIRLDGFEGEWVEVNLGTLIDNRDEIISGASGFPIATSSRKGLYLQNDYFEGGRTGIDLTLDFHRVPMGYVTYRHMSDDSIFKFNKNNLETDVLVSKEYPVFISNDSSDIDFLLYHLNNSRLFLRFSTMQKLGGTRVRLYYKNLITYKLAVPTIKEQQAIGSYFSNLDNLITAHQEKISQLETLKKKLLQDMFI
ncbi:restriction endonuclease subunit S [Streptococcus gordonii]|uniref:HsdS specificity protein of type I restriction-modification system n=1 Tax=Streptococcus gordonii (strain Challis / ATCC 35105 / BCRC 15272 / CH1 / DL1 / V288) TaxID=467705 RepID=A8AVR3_STRGC|nr:restriction endonuclease subunit S [Streptococcus gordonii]ABV11142.1 HsdS specificity protein of type I restriction-modification system [Streptococcus gordonii str. Challis substr. CH1]MBZ2136773.1 restriction endonuclease subunit S [Streptococcus gordonii]QGS44905.1 restriction endonuclease subunit S [Streptococcus gordonii]VEE20636.1 HsdS specificity protein of type I restriction-modification system [Streptococcus gordonii]VTS77921.1 HsdS specificity protein of type I restriction-modific